MPLKATVQRRARQTRDRRLQCVEAIVQWQQRMQAKCDRHRFLIFAQHARAWFFRTGLLVFDRSATAPLGHRLGIDSNFAAQPATEACVSRQTAAQSPASQWIAVCELGSRASSRRCHDEFVP